jgi:hypothetical protein
MLFTFWCRKIFFTDANVHQRHKKQSLGDKRASESVFQHDIWAQTCRVRKGYSIIWIPKTKASASAKGLRQRPWGSRVLICFSVFSQNTLESKRRRPTWASTRCNFSALLGFKWLSSVCFLWLHIFLQMVEWFFLSFRPQSKIMWSGNPFSAHTVKVSDRQC